MTRTSLLAITTVAAIGLLPPAGCKKDDAPTSGAPAGATPKLSPSATATRVEVATLRVGQRSSTIVRPGEVEGSREAHLASALGGFVERVLVETGDKVKRGQVVAYVDSTTHGAQARITKIEVADAKRELARLEQLGKAIASARVDAARTRLELAQAQHALSGTRYSRSAIKAPFSGVIVGLHVEKGEVLAPGAPVCRLIQLDPIYVSVSVTDRDVAALAVGGAASVTTGAQATPIEGVVHRIEPAADMKTRTFLIEVKVDNKDKRLLPGMIAEVAFDNKRDNEVLRIPQDFLVTRRSGNGVFVAVEDGDKTTASWRPTKLGAIIGTDVEIVEGVEEGAVIVVLGHRRLSEGDELIVSRKGECCERGRVVYPSQKNGAPPVPSQRAEIKADATKGSDDTAAAKPTAAPTKDEPKEKTQ